MREWLRTSRKQSGLTMKQMGEKLHVSESYYCAIENGVRQRDMDLSLACKLSDVLQIPIKGILAAEEELRRTRTENE